MADITPEDRAHWRTVTALAIREPDKRIAVPCVEMNALLDQADEADRLRAELERSRTAHGALVADWKGLQDGSLVADLRARVAELERERDEATARAERAEQGGKCGVGPIARRRAEMRVRVTRGVSKGKREGMTRTLNEWAAWLRHQAQQAQERSHVAYIHLDVLDATLLAAVLDVAEAEHERDLADLRERCATVAYHSSELADGRPDSVCRKAVRAVPLRKEGA